MLQPNQSNLTEISLLQLKEIESQIKNPIQNIDHPQQYYLISTENQNPTIS